MRSKALDPTAGQKLLQKSEIVKQFSQQAIPASSDELIALLPNLPDVQTLLEVSQEPSKPV